MRSSMCIFNSNLTIFSAIVGCCIIAGQQDSEPGYERKGPMHESSFRVNLKPEGSEIFRKRKKKQKASSKMKRHNRSMGKKLKRKNDDSVRDRLQ